MSSELNRALIEAVKATTRLIRAHTAWQENKNKANGVL
jgi:hypothetical protein